MSPSASKLKKKAKARLSRNKPKQDKSEDNPIDPDHPDKSNQNAATENSSDWKSTVSATAKLVLCTVRDSADAFPPLKSVAGGLCFILENYEVRSTSCPSPRPQCSRSSSGRKELIKR